MKALDRHEAPRAYDIAGETGGDGSLVRGVDVLGDRDPWGYRQVRTLN